MKLAAKSLGQGSSQSTELLLSEEEVKKGKGGSGTKPKGNPQGT